MLQNVRSNTRRNNLAATIFFVIFWAFLFFFYPYHLVYKEQTMLFLWDTAYFEELLGKPAFLAVIVGDFLTQFFIYKLAAASITVIVTVFFWDSLRRFFARQGFNSPALCAMLPAAAELALGCHHEYPVSMTIGAALAALSILGCSYIKNNKVRRTVEIIAPALLYPLIGAHTLIFIVLSFVEERKSAIPALLLVIAGISSIAIEGHTYTLIWQEAVSYPVIHGYSMRMAFMFVLTEVSLIVASFVGMFTRNSFIPVALTFLIAGITICSLFDGKEEYDLKISTLAYFGKWNDVKEMGKNNPFHSQTGAYYYNLAMAKDGMLAENLLKTYQPLFYGLFLPVQMNEPYTKVIASTDALMECGDYAQAQHSAMLGMNFTPRQRSSRAVRKMAELAVFNGDSLAAGRYLGMLKKTTLHAGWAADVESLLAEGTAVPINSNRDTIFAVNDFQGALRNILDSAPASFCAVDYLLCYDLLTKNIGAFIYDYDRYYFPLKRGTVPPRIYQEALEMLEAGSQYNVSARVKEDNQSFLNGNEYMFKDSYWFYFKYAEPGE